MEEAAASPPASPKILNVTKKEIPSVSHPTDASEHDEEGFSTAPTTQAAPAPAEMTFTPEPETLTSNDKDSNNGDDIPREESLPTIRTASSASPSRSIVSSIVIRQTNESLQLLRANLRQASVNLLQSLGNHLSQQDQSVGGISLPASAVGWLASQTAASSSNLQNLLPRLTHLRLTAATWPPQSSSSSTVAAAPFSPPQSPATLQQLQQQYVSLQSFHRLRYNPEVNVAIFPNLQVLLLDQVPPDWIVHLPKLQATLQVLRVERASLYDLETFLLGPVSAEQPVTYPQLSHVKLTHCNLGSQTTRGLAANDEDPEQRLPLASMPRLASLSLAHNEITCERTIQESGISNAPWLSKLDLSYNQIPSFHKAPLYIGNLQTLILTGNNFETAEGLDRLHALQTLALDHNQIRSWLHVKGLARLPELSKLELRGNPFMEADRKYVRVMLLDLFREQRWASSTRDANSATFRQLEFLLPVIDGKPVSDRELRALQQRAFVTVVRAPDRSFLVVEEAEASANNNYDNSSPKIGAGENNRETPLSEGRTLVPGLRRTKRKQRRVVTAIIEDETRGRPTGNHKRAAKLTLEPATELNGTKAARAPSSKRSGTKVAPPDEEKKETENLPERGGTKVAQIVAYEKERKRSGLEVGEAICAPKVAFGIQDVIMSLSVNEDVTKSTIEEKTQGSDEQTNVQNGNVKALEKEELPDQDFPPKKKDPVTDFEWPQPMPYLPTENLYKEFVWTPPSTISLSEGGKQKKKKKQKARKKKNSQVQKLKKKPPPTINTEAVSTQEGNSTASRKTKRPAIPTGTQSRATRSLSPRATKARTKSPGARSTSSLSKGGSTKAKGKGHRGEAGNGPEWASLAHQRSTQQDHDEEQAANTGKVEDVNYVEWGSPTNEARRPRSHDSLRDSSDGEQNDAITPNSRSSFNLAMESDDISMGTNRSGTTAGTLKGPSKQDKFHLAEMKSKFLGMEQERGLSVASSLGIYFKTFVFPDFVPNLGSGQLDEDADTWQSVFFRYPRIQLLPKDRDLRELRKKGRSVEMRSRGVENREQFVRVWREDVVACGKPALRRLPPNRTAHFGFHGELSWLEGKVKTVSECRGVIICLSNTSLYIIVDNDSLTAKEEAPAPGNESSHDAQTAFAEEIPTTSRRKQTRRFPSPMPSDATFEQALWPHAVSCHPLADVLGITIGFGFQRMTLRIRNSAYPSAVDFTYQLLTSNKMKTVDLLRELQGLAKEVKLEMGQSTLTDEAIKIDNDDRQFLDALASTVAPEPLGAVLHYQILKQRWKHGQRGAVSRICVVTDAKIFLLDEDYVGDGSESVAAENSRRLGSPSFRLIDAADLQQISEVRAADADPNAITIVIRPSQKLLRTHRWRLLCRDRSGAEKLVEDVRKAMTLVDL